MDIYLKVINATIVDRVVSKRPIDGVAIGPDGEPIWRKWVPQDAPSFDPATHKAPTRKQLNLVGSPIFTSGPTVVESWNAPVAKTQAELDAEKNAQTQSEVFRSKRKRSLERAFVETLFEIAKAARTSDWSGFVLLDGTPVTTKLQFAQYIEEKIRAD